jgi:hypothetical protein
VDLIIYNLYLSMLLMEIISQEELIQENVNGTMDLLY